MAFIITRDWITEAINKDRDENDKMKLDKGITGPRSISDTTVARLKAGEGVKFKMYDDDGELYYDGRYIEENDSDEMEPLDCFGMPNAGCTSIKMKSAKTGEWEYI